MPQTKELAEAQSRIGRLFRTPTALYEMPGRERWDRWCVISVDGMPGLRDEALSSDGRFLYAIDADSGRICGWSVDADGALEPIGSWEGVPKTVAGLAAS